MECNNKHILEESREDEKLIGGLMSCGDDKIKDNNHKNIASSR